MCTKFQPGWSTHTQVLAIFAKCAKRKKNEEIFGSLIAHILEECSSNLECGLSWVEGTSTVNLVPLGSDITELWLHENRNFVVPVNILTSFVCAPFSWAAQHTQHTTMCLDHKMCMKPSKIKGKFHGTCLINRGQTMYNGTILICLYRSTGSLWLWELIIVLFCIL